VNRQRQPNDMILCLADRKTIVLIPFNGAEEALTARDSLYRAGYQWRTSPA
jgi:hypothetical protein